MIRCGKLCRYCTSECRDLSTDSEPVTVECPECRGNGKCEHCNDGWFDVKGCPSRYCSEMGTVLKCVDLFDKGIPPVAGGVLDQSAWFVNAVQRVNNEEARIKAEL